MKAREKTWDYAGDLDPFEKQLLFKPVTGKGGDQSLFRKLQRQVSGYQSVCEKDDIRRVADLLNRGDGGYQRRIPTYMRKICIRLGLWQPKPKPKKAKQEALF